MPEITVQFIDGSTRTFAPGTEEKLLLGRDEEQGADLQLGSPLVSREHAKIWVDGEGVLRIEQLSEINDTFINGRAITRSDPQRLSDGDEVMIKPFVLAVSRAAGNGGSSSAELANYHISVSVSEDGIGKADLSKLAAGPDAAGAPRAVASRPGLPGIPTGLATIRAPSSDETADPEVLGRAGELSEGAQGDRGRPPEMQDVPEVDPQEVLRADGHGDDSLAAPDRREDAPQADAPESKGAATVAPEAGLAVDGDVDVPEATEPDAVAAGAGPAEPDRGEHMEDGCEQRERPVERGARSELRPEAGQTSREPPVGEGAHGFQAALGGKIRGIFGRDEDVGGDDEEITKSRPVETMQPKLLVRSMLEGMTPNQPVPIWQSPATVGSSESCTVTLKDRTVSECHAELERVDLEWCVTDLHSTNGVFVNDQPIPPDEPYPLGDLDLIRFGTVEVQFVPEESHTIRVGGGRKSEVVATTNWRRRAIVGLLSVAALLIALLGVMTLARWREARALKEVEDRYDRIAALNLLGEGDSLLSLDRIQEQIVHLGGRLGELEGRAVAAGERGCDYLKSGRAAARKKVLGLCGRLMKEPKEWLMAPEAERQALFDHLPAIAASLAPIEEILGYASAIVPEAQATALKNEVAALNGRWHVVSRLRENGELVGMAYPKDEDDLKLQMQRLGLTIGDMESEDFTRDCARTGYTRMHASILDELWSRLRDFANSDSYETRGYEVLTGLFHCDLEPEHRVKKVGIAEEWFNRVARSDLRNRGIRTCEQCSIALMVFKEASVYYRERDYERMGRIPMDLGEQLPTEMLRKHCAAQVVHSGLLSREAARWGRTYAKSMKEPQLAADSLLKKLRDMNDDVGSLEAKAYLVSTSLSKRRLRCLTLAAYYAENAKEALGFAEEVSPSLSRKLRNVLEKLRPAFDRHRTGLGNPGENVAEIEKVEREFVREADPEFEYRQSRQLAAIANTEPRE